ncbi:hypothetical protein EON67_07425 [archaeon]|nr:MAG: hypothetical protein EON67_07425 [archaeon]
MVRTRVRGACAGSHFALLENVPNPHSINFCISSVSSTFVKRTRSGASFACRKAARAFTVRLICLYVLHDAVDGVAASRLLLPPSLPPAPAVAATLALRTGVCVTRFGTSTLRSGVVERRIGVSVRRTGVSERRTGASTALRREASALRRGASTAAASIKSAPPPSICVRGRDADVSSSISRSARSEPGVLDAAKVRPGEEPTCASGATSAADMLGEAGGFM